MALTAAEISAIESIKAKVNEIDQIVTESLAIQAGGGYHIRNVAIEAKAILEGLVPTEEKEEDKEVEPDGSLENPLKPEGDNIQPVNE